MKGSWRLRPCISIPIVEAAVDGEVEGDAAPDGAPPPESRAVRMKDLVGRRQMMTSNMSSGRLLMKSRLAGCAFGSSRLFLLADLPSISTGGDAGVHVCWCVLCAGCAQVRPSVYAAAQW